MGADDRSTVYLTAAGVEADVAPASPTPSGSSSSSSSAVNHTLLLQSDDVGSRVEAAMEIRRLTKTSQRYRRHFSAAVGPLVDMLRCQSADAKEAALAALLNLAVKDEINKINIIDAGALKPIISSLQSENLALQEHAAAALVTLSASSAPKAIITASGAIPHLLEVLKNGSSLSQADALTALCNLSTHPDNLIQILQAKPVLPLINILKCCKRSSKTEEKCAALIESVVVFEEGRTALTSEKGGILAVVEVLEGGSRQSREHAVGALLTMCQSNREVYREPILREGVVPGLLELTVQGTPKSQAKAHMLLRLLRDTPYPRSELKPDALEKFVCNIISQTDSQDQSEKAKQMLAEMVQISMEQSLMHLQNRAVICTPAADLPVNSHASEVPSK